MNTYLVRYGLAGQGMLRFGRARLAQARGRGRGNTRPRSYNTEQFIINGKFGHQNTKYQSDLHIAQTKTSPSHPFIPITPKEYI